MALPVAQDLKNYLRVQTTAEDAAIAGILAAAKALALTYLNRPVTALARTYTIEDRRAAALGLSRLSYDPVAATFIRAPDAPIDLTQPFTLTDRFGTTLDTTMYRVDGVTGVIRGGSASTPYSSGFSAFPYTCVCTTGLATRTDYAQLVEPAIFAAILDIGADLYQRRNPAATDENDGAGGSVRYGRSEETIPSRAIEMLAPYRRPSL